MSEKKVLRCNKFWDINLTRKYPKYLFVYGDNDQYKGKGGQAIIRYESNTIGILTKKRPDENDGAFFTDEELKENKLKIDNCFNQIRKRQFDFA